MPANGAAHIPIGLEQQRIRADGALFLADEALLLVAYLPGWRRLTAPLDQAREAVHESLRRFDGATRQNSAATGRPGAVPGGVARELQALTGRLEERIAAVIAAADSTRNDLGIRADSVKTLVAAARLLRPYAPGSSRGQEMLDECAEQLRRVCGDWPGPRRMPTTVGEVQAVRQNLGRLHLALDSTAAAAMPFPSAASCRWMPAPRSS